MARLLAVLALLAIAGLAEAETFALNSTGNLSWSGPYAWSGSTGAVLDFTSGDLSDLSITANGTEVWNWSRRANVTGATSPRYEGYQQPDRQDRGIYVGNSGSEEYKTWFGPVPGNVEAWVRWIPGTSGMTAYGVLNLTVAWTNEAVQIDAVTRNNSNYTFASNRTIPSLQPEGIGAGYWIPLGPNGTLVTAASQGYAGEGTVSAWTGRASGPPYSVTLGASDLPLRVNGSGNFSVVGTVTTDEVWVWPWATVEGLNVTATVNLTDGERTFSLPTEQWSPVKPGRTYAVQTRFAGLGCQSGEVSFPVSANGSYPGCVIVASPPSPVNRPASAPAGGGGGGGGAPVSPVSTPPPETAAPAPAPVAAPQNFGGPSSSLSRPLPAAQAKTELDSFLDGKTPTKATVYVPPGAEGVLVAGVEVTPNTGVVGTTYYGEAVLLLGEPGA